MKCVKCKQEVPDGKYCIKCGTCQSVSVQQRQKIRSNGSGTAFKRGRTWSAQVTIGWKTDEKAQKLIPVRKTKGGFKTKREALEYCVELRSSMGVVKRDATLAKLWSIYEQTKLPKLSQSKQTSYRIAYRKLSDLVYAKIENIDIGMLQGLVEGRSYYEAKDIKILLSHLYKIACAQQDVATNLAQYIELPELIESEQTPFSDDELKALWSGYDAGDTWVGYILLMIYSGMMPGELLKCEKSMIDLPSNQIIGCGIKTAERKAQPIVIADFIVPVVESLLQLTKGRRLISANKDRFYQRYYETLEKYGCRRLTPYSCRHTTATALAIGSNIAPSIIQRIMRHAKITTTQRYIHPDSSDSVAAINTLNPHIRPVETPTQKIKMPQ